MRVCGARGRAGHGPSEQREGVTYQEISVGLDFDTDLDVRQTQASEDNSDTEIPSPARTSEAEQFLRGKHEERSPNGGHPPASLPSPERGSTSGPPRGPLRRGGLSQVIKGDRRGRRGVPTGVNGEILMEVLAGTT